VDATITMGPKGILTTPAEDGRAVDPAPVIAAALDAARRVDVPPQVDLPVVTSPIPPTLSDGVVATAKARAQRLIRNVVVTFDDKHWTIKAWQVRTWVSFETADGAVAPVVDPAPIAKALGRVQKGVLRKPLEASFLTSKSGHVVGVVAGRNGRRLNVEATVGRIVAELGRRADGGAAKPIRARAVRVEPKLTTDEATKSAPLMTLLGSWTTWFPISERNFFGANIWRPAQIINGTVLAPGQSFDWWRDVGPVTAARGFGPGGVIRVDHTEPTGALGGGMCSSSTTLFNAALRAGLQMGARSNHRYYINRYPLGLDATVSIMGGGVQTMSFTNDTDHAILIRGIRIGGSSGRGHVRYEIWGIPDGRTVSLSRPAVTNRLVATTNTVVVTTLPHGERVQTEFPSDGMDVAVTRVVRDRSGRVIHSETYRSHYVLWNGRIEVGA
jgi:vancomycin resistance protein YoaR